MFRRHGTRRHDQLRKGLHPDLRLVEGETPVVFLEHFAHIHGGIEVVTPRTVVLKSGSDCDVTSTLAAEGGVLFFEDVVKTELGRREEATATVKLKYAFVAGLLLAPLASTTPIGR
jgi:hypothetical protein